LIKALFVCSRNKLRSPTAEAIFSARGDVEALSAGTSPDAENSISTDLIEWADTIFAMERIHRKRLNERFGSLLRGKRIVVLGIPDHYEYMDTELIAILKKKVPQHLRAPAPSNGPRP
jgi:predicted protein tyrosine phosphatase